MNETPSPQSEVPLYHAEGPDAWHCRTTQELGSESIRHAIVILPVYTWCRWRGDWPLDADERVSAQVFADARARPAVGAAQLVLPPLRHAPRQEDRQMFCLPLEAAYRVAMEIIGSAAESGFRTFVLYHGHPGLTDWLEVLGREMRVEKGLWMYRIGLHGVGIDLSARARESGAVLPTQDEPEIVQAGGRLAGLLQEIATHAARRAGEAS